jgi:hypothetical protein
MQKVSGALCVRGGGEDPRCTAAGFTPGNGHGGVGWTCALQLGGWITAQGGWRYLNIHQDEFEACRTAGAKELNLR